MIPKVEQKYESSKAQGILKEYGDFLRHTIEQISKEMDSPINEDTAEKVGLEYARRQAGKNALKLLMQRLNTKSNERN